MSFFLKNSLKISPFCLSLWRFQNRFAFLSFVSFLFFERSLQRQKQRRKQLDNRSTSKKKTFSKLDDCARVPRPQPLGARHVARRKKEKSKDEESMFFPFRKEPFLLFFLPRIPRATEKSLRASVHGAWKENEGLFRARGRENERRCSIDSSLTEMTTKESEAAKEKKNRREKNKNEFLFFFFFSFLFSFLFFLFLQFSFQFSFFSFSVFFDMLAPHPLSLSLHPAAAAKRKYNQIVYSGAPHPSHVFPDSGHHPALLGLSAGGVYTIASTSARGAPSAASSGVRSTARP